MPHRADGQEVHTVFFAVGLADFKQLAAGLASRRDNGIGGGDDCFTGLQGADRVGLADNDRLSDNHCRFYGAFLHYWSSEKIKLGIF